MSIEERLERLCGPALRALVPYHVEDARGMVKLDAMENPYLLPDELQRAWVEVLRETGLNRYPDPHSTALKAALAEHLGLPDSLGITLGNGSDELIHLICLAFARGEGGLVLCPEPTFAVYRIAAGVLGVPFTGVPLRSDDFSLDLEAMLAAIAAAQPTVVFLASPNNPTGNRLDLGTLEALCAATPGVVVLDEAYYRFSTANAGRSRALEAAGIENLLVMQTLSKIGLAGLRVGALIAQAPWIDLIERLRMPYNIGTLAQASAHFALTHIAAFQRQIDAIVHSRAALALALARLPGVRVWPSETNFILFRVGSGSGRAVFDGLKARGVLVKFLGNGHPALTDCLRVTVGTDDENGQFLAALAQALATA